MNKIWDNLVAELFMSFLIAGFIWVFYELLSDKVGWWAGFLFLYVVVFGIIFGVSRAMRDET